MLKYPWSIFIISLFMITVEVFLLKEGLVPDGFWFGACAYLTTFVLMLSAIAFLTVGDEKNIPASENIMAFLCGILALFPGYVAFAGTMSFFGFH